jgi:hypothetical protein
MDILRSVVTHSFSNLDYVIAKETEFHVRKWSGFLKMRSFVSKKYIIDRWKYSHTFWRAALAQW